MTEHEKEICLAALETWGPDVQKLIVFEQIAEFLKIYAKSLRTNGNYGEMIDEIADMEIVLQQLKFMFRAEPEVDAAISRKLRHLEAKIQGHNHE